MKICEYHGVAQKLLYPCERLEIESAEWKPLERYSRNPAFSGHYCNPLDELIDEIRKLDRWKKYDEWC